MTTYFPTSFWKQIFPLAALFMGVCLTSCNTSKSLVQTSTNSNLNKVIIDKKEKSQLSGLSTRAGMLEAPFSEWYQSNYDAYEPKPEVLKLCKGKLKDIEIKAFMGTWCGDSRLAVPQFYKTLDLLKFDESKLTLVNLDRSSPNYKQSPTHEERGMNIHRVPTFIFYKDGKELGRIVESPVTDLETDMAQLLNGIPTRARYGLANKLGELFAEKGAEYVEENLLPIARKYSREARRSSELNTYGYVLKDANKLDEARCVFRMNTMIFPEDANTHDSLGELYFELENKEKALLCYEKALELKPKDEHVQEMIEKVNAMP